MAQTFTATASTDGWTLTAKKTTIAGGGGGGVNYFLTAPGGSTYPLGSNPSSAFKVDSTIPDNIKKLLNGAAGYKSLSINGKPNEVVAAGSEIDTLLASIGPMAQQTAQDIAKQEQVAAPAPAPAPTPVPAASPATTAAPNTTANTITTTKLTSNTITKTTVTNTTNTTANSKTTTTTVKSATTTTDPSKTTTNPAPAPKPVPKPVVTETATSITTRTNGVDIVVDKKPVVTETATSITTRTNGVDIVVDKTAPTTSPANVEPQTGPTAPAAGPPVTGLSSGISGAAGAATAQDQANFLAKEDWRVRLSLAPGSNYLYNDPSGNTILQPLKKTDGVIFPYTPGITVNYAASYEQASLTHTNYKINQYQSSSVDQVQLTCDFTAQDVNEANYVLAVIHFFRSMTKMFYGQDSNPKNGTPPPLCYLFGLGGYQFDALPLAISGFNYSLPQDVDYIKTTGAAAAGTPQPSVQNGATGSGRLGPGILPGGKGAAPSYGTTPTQSSESTTWVPTKIQLSVTCLPIMSRNQVSNYFSLKDYANGTLLQGTKRKGGGFW